MFEFPDKEAPMISSGDKKIAGFGGAGLNGQQDSDGTDEEPEEQIPNMNDMNGTEETKAQPPVP